MKFLTKDSTTPESAAATAARLDYELVRDWYSTKEDEVTAKQAKDAATKFGVEVPPGTDHIGIVALLKEQADKVAKKAFEAGTPLHGAFERWLSQVPSNVRKQLFGKTEVDAKDVTQHNGRIACEALYGTYFENLNHKVRVEGVRKGVEALYPKKEKSERPWLLPLLLTLLALAALLGGLAWYYSRQPVVPPEAAKEALNAAEFKAWADKDPAVKAALAGYCSELLGSVGAPCTSDAQCGKDEKGNSLMCLPNPDKSAKGHTCQVKPETTPTPAPAPNDNVKTGKHTGGDKGGSHKAANRSAGSGSNRATGNGNTDTNRGGVPRAGNVFGGVNTPSRDSVGVEAVRRGVAAGSK